MVRDERLEQPDPEAVADAVSRACGRAVTDVDPVPKGINAIYRVAFADGGRAVCKVATFNATAELRPEPLLLDRVARETTVPVPDVLTTVEDGASLGAFAYLLDHVDGRQVRDLTALPPDARERLVRELGRLLARLHEYRPVESCGPLRVATDAGDPAEPPSPTGDESPSGSAGGSRFTTGTRFDSWGETFAALADHPVDLFARVHGGEEYGDDFGGPGRFADLVPEVVAAFDGVADAVAEPERPTVLHRDFHLDNVVLDPDDDAESLVRAVLDFADPYVGDYRLDLAFAEDAVVNVQLPLSEEADRLRELLRTAYARERGVDPAAVVDERYAYYLLVQRCRWMAVAEDWDGYDDPAAVERAYRSFVTDRLAEIA